MIIEMILFGLLLAIGLYLIFLDALNVPKLATEKALNSAIKESENIKKGQTFSDTCIEMIAGIINLDEYKRANICDDLRAADMEIEPEMFIAGAVYKGLLTCLLIIPILILFPILSPLVFVLAILIYFKEIKKPNDIMQKKREKIESELPRFTATIAQELKSSRDVLSIIELYKKNAGPEFANELEILTADMKSSSYESALTRFEARINSPKLSDISRGLISVLRGDDGIAYFQMLEHDMKQMEIQMLEKEANKIPGKIKVFSMIMLGCFIAIFMTVILYQVIVSLGQMF